MLLCLFSLREEWLDFFVDEKLELVQLVTNDKWLPQLSYLSDIFGEINKLNKNMQGGNLVNKWRHSKES